MAPKNTCLGQALCGLLPCKEQANETTPLKENISNQIIHIHCLKQELLYIPTYVSTVIKKITLVNHQEQTATLAFTAVFRFLVEGLPQSIIDQLSKSFSVQINSKICNLEDGSPNATFRVVSEKDENGQDKPKYVVCTLRDEKEIDFEPHRQNRIPFDYLRFKLELEVVDKVVECSLEDWQNTKDCKRFAEGEKYRNECSKPSKVKIKFITHAPQAEDPHPKKKSKKNQGQTQQTDQMQTEEDTPPLKKSKTHREHVYQLSVQTDDKKFKTENVLNYREDILIPGFDVMYQPPTEYQSIELVYDQLKKTRFHYSSRIRFSVYAWRNPLSMILKYNIPVILLQLLTLAILAQDDGLGDKISNIATIVLALVAFVPSIKGEISHVKSMTLLESIIYSAVYQAGFVLLEAVITHYYDRIEVVRRAAFIISLLFLAYSLLALGIPYTCDALYRAKKVSEFKKPKRMEQDGNDMCLNKWYSPETGLRDLEKEKEERQKKKKEEDDSDEEEEKLENILVIYKSPCKCCDKMIVPKDKHS